MTKEDIINELWITQDVCMCGYPRSMLEKRTKKQLLKWLRELEGAA